MTEVKRGLNELYMRRQVAQRIISLVDSIAEVDDPEGRKPEALEYYKGQLAKFDTKIAAITGKPPPIVVGLKTASLTGTSGLK